MILFVPLLSSRNTIELSLEQTRHLKAKRIAHSKECITLSDGKYSAQATLSESKKSILATYDSLTELPSRSVKLTLYFSVIKPDRMSWLVEKAVEIGIDRLVPIYSERSQGTHWNKSTAEHLHKVIISACTQSLQLTPPMLQDPLFLEKAIAPLKGLQELCFYGALNAQSQSPKELILGKEQALHLFIGPEGGWSPNDLKTLDDSCTPVYYPGPILRTETACIVLGSMLQGMRLL